jgi:phenylalanyl-tRNA synthetase beta chain
LFPAALPSDTFLRPPPPPDKALIAEVRLFDVYAGAGLPEGRKSLAITIVLQPEGATLTDEQIEAVSQKIVAQVTKATGGELRR